MSDNNAAPDNDAAPGQGPQTRPTAVHNMPPNSASEAAEIILSADGEGKAESPDLLDS